MGKVITILQQKGGCGKTTLAVNLAAELKHMYPDLKIAVLDADGKQQSAYDWIVRSKGRMGVSVIPLKDSEEGALIGPAVDEANMDITVIDLPPEVESIAMRGARKADLVLIPVGQSGQEIKSAGKALRVAADEVTPFGHKFLLVPSSVDFRTLEGAQLREYLETKGPVSRATIRYWGAHMKTFTAGTSIREQVRNSSNKKPLHEFIELAQEVSEIIGLSLKEAPNVG